VDRAGGEAGVDVKEHPTLFSAEMVRRLLDGSKTQTRRLVTPRTSVLGSSTWDALDWSARWREPDRRERTRAEIEAALDRPRPAKREPFDFMMPDGGGPANFFCPFEDTAYLHVPAKDGETRHRCYPRVIAGDRLWVKETFRSKEHDVGTQVEYRATPDASHRLVDPWKPSIFMRRSESRLVLDVKSVRVERLHAITEADARAEGVERRPDGPGRMLSAVGVYEDLWNRINGTRAPWSSNPLVWVYTFARST
jgi:hypothetical protein